MPGIVGIISKGQSKTNELTLETMLNVMKYESFYSSGKYLNAEVGICLGWTVHHKSFCDCLPIFNETNDVIMVFYGENHIEVGGIDGLIGKHAEPLNATNASYLVHLYEEDKSSFIRNLNGWFCGVIIDLQEKKAVLFNDRYGMQRLYFHESKDFFYFSSEAKSILRVMPSLRTIPTQSLAELFSCRCVLENRSLFQDIHLLPGGSCWEIREGEVVDRKYYFDPASLEKLPSFEKPVFLDRLRTTVRHALPKYFHAGDRIAFSLTGGLDTRTILSNITVDSKNIQCYSHGGAYRDCFDVKIARQVAEKLGLAHHTLRIDDTFIIDFPSLATTTVYASDGYMDVNGAPSLYLHRKARSLGNVRMTGNFGDQVLVGHRDLYSSPNMPIVLNKEMEKHWNNAIVSLSRLSQGSRLSFFLFKQAPWYDYARFAVEQSQLVQRSPFMDNDLVALLYQAPRGTLDAEDLRVRLIKEGNPELSMIPTERGYLGRNLLFSRYLRLYRRCLFTAEYYFSYGMPNWLAVLDSYVHHLNVDRLVLELNKYYNLRRLFRYQLSAYIKEILLDPRTLNRSFINRSALERAVIAHTTGRGNYTSSINMVLSIELAMRSLFETY